MSLLDNGNGMYMPVAPAGNGYGGNGMFGDGAFWLIVLFLFAIMGGNGLGGYGNGGGAVYNVDSSVQRGFDQQAVMGAIGGVQGSIGALAQGQCQGFANAEIAANGRQMASMQQLYGAQSAIDGRLDSLAMNQQAGLFENRAAIADVKYAIARDGAETRANTDAKMQTVMDKLCQMEIDNIKQNYENKIALMQNQIDALSDQVNKADRRVAMGEEIDGLYNRLKNCPVGTVPVAGNVPIFSMQPSCPCGQATPAFG